ncbi:hypothetical protein [Mesoflavibacter sp. SCSIO 43206]|uniref:hypothetical protein n=1 Tax=Mesoflavibacter sp. SCSIO 43206 TaxID=2779362 RepID=UPI001CA8725F|nr:hypothetical protein [Mesoflavibacter sp. SCSIO 43206]UAB75142.1 hypothetical protein INR78_12230 [Mesoflavibacter sp. SCSIO 43206]
MFEKILKIITGGNGIKDVADILQDVFKGKDAKRREFEILLAERLKESVEIEIKDLQNAREMQIEALKQEDRFSKRFVYYLTAFLLFVTSCLAIIPYLFEFPQANLDMIKQGQNFFYMVSGARIIAFFFGSKTQLTQNNK